MTIYSVAAKRRKKKLARVRNKLKEQIEKLENEILQLKRDIRDQSSSINQYKRKETKWAESEQDFIKKIYILQEFMIRSHSVINRRAARHMRALKKAMNLDSKIFDTLMQKQEWSLKLDENKKQLTNSIKEMEEFSKSFGGGDVLELDRLKTKISEDLQIDKNDDLDGPEDEEVEIPHMHRSASVYTPKIKNNFSGGSNDLLDTTLDLKDDFLTPNNRNNMFNKPGSKDLFLSTI